MKKFVVVRKDAAGRTVRLPIFATSGPAAARLADQFMADQKAGRKAGWRVA